jgi:hypothetical protein
MHSICLLSVKQTVGFYELQICLWGELESIWDQSDRGRLRKDLNEINMYDDRLRLLRININTINFVNYQLYSNAPST